MLPAYNWEELALLWNVGDYRAVHDWLNVRWSDLVQSRVLRDEDPDARFLQGLAFAALALHFTEVGNHEGARMMMDDAQLFLAPYVPSHQGVAVEPVLEMLVDLRAGLAGVPWDATCVVQRTDARRFRLARVAA
jgi:uncharacterized protein